MSQNDLPDTTRKGGAATHAPGTLAPLDNAADVDRQDSFGIATKQKTRDKIRQVMVDPIKKGMPLPSTLVPSAEWSNHNTRPFKTTVANMNKKVYDKVVRRMYDPSPFTRLMHETKQEHEAMEIPDVAPDMSLHNMDVIIRKVLKNVTVRDYYETIWSEGVGCDKQPFYGPWLSDGSKHKVNVEDWQFAEPGNEFEGLQDEKYPQKRVVDIEFVRTTHLYAGPPVIKVRHTHYCRNEGEDRCIVSKIVEIEGIPLTDCFNTQIRWVASRVGDSDILIEVGVDVVFVKSTLLASKIRAGAKEETMKGQTNLFEHIVLALDAETAESERKLEAVEPEPEVFESSCSRFGDFVSRLLGRRVILADRADDVAVGVRGIDEKLKTVVLALEQSDLRLERENEILESLSTANRSLEHVLSCLS